MPYEKTAWKNDQYDTPPDTYIIEDLGDGTFRIQRAGTRTQQGTLLNATNLNKIESGIEAAHKLVETDIHTPDQSQTAQASGALLTLQGFFANMLKRILGTTNWHDAPPITLQSTKAHTEAGAAHGATSQAVAAKIIVRDAYGRAKVAAPSAADDIARLDSITKTQAGLGNVTNDKQATKAEFDAKMHATTGHKHTGVAGDGSKLDPATGLVWQPARSATGQYKGDDAASREIIVGFAPRLVVVAVNSATAVLLIPSRVVPLNYLTSVMQNNYLTSTGFTVGTSIGDKNLNDSSATYFWVALG